MDNFQRLTEEMYESNREYGFADKIRIKKIVEIVGNNNKILDVGCYRGFLSKLLLDNGNEVFGIDIAKKALIQARKLGIKTQYADLEKKIPFVSNSFDLVVAAEIIEHIKDTDNFLSEIKRVLRPNGYLVISTSNLVSLGRRISYLLGGSGYHEASFFFPKGAAGHLRYFTKDLLIGLLELHDFKIDIFTSDVINFTNDTKSKLQSSSLAKYFPTFGRSLIVKAKKT